MGSADTGNADGRRGSNVYKVDHWFWMFGSSKPCLGGPETAVGGVVTEHRAQLIIFIKLKPFFRKEARKAFKLSGADRIAELSRAAKAVK
jgi:hypothetical protein